MSKFAQVVLYPAMPWAPLAGLGTSCHGRQCLANKCDPMTSVRTFVNRLTLSSTPCERCGDAFTEVYVPVTRSRPREHPASRRAL
ncbi:hypothetical protein OH77DRAFT_1425087 [Trametes cingulata]|nr:hypothetical protein OH77DRAFT_1425087 [Trametes cingulata]